MHVMDEDLLRQRVFDALKQSEQFYVSMGHKGGNAARHCNRCLVEDVKAISMTITGEAMLDIVDDDRIIPYINEWRETNNAIEPARCAACLPEPREQPFWASPAFVTVASIVLGAIISALFFWFG